METLDLARISTDENVGTFGVLKWQREPAPFAVSLEDPWRDNKRNVSCIPAGKYQCKRFSSPTHGPTFIVMDVPDRTFILLHRGNTHINTQGCILVGENYTFLNGLAGIGSSRLGFDEFMKYSRDMTEFEINIYWACDNLLREPPDENYAQSPFVSAIEQLAEEHD